MSENYTKGVKRILKYSKEESIRLSTTYVGSEHLLLGIIKDADGDAYKLLSTIGCDFDKIKNQIEKEISTNNTSTSIGHLPLTRRLERILKKQVLSSATVMILEQSGLKSAAKIMNHVKPEMEKTIMSSLLKRDSKTMESIREKMYTFDNFILSDKNSLENLLRNIDIDDLSISLKCANDDIRSKFFNCMSKSAAKNILNDIKEMGPVRLSEIQSAQKRILTVAKQLSDNGSVFFAANRNKETYA